MSFVVRYSHLNHELLIEEKTAADAGYLVDLCFELVTSSGVLVEGLHDTCPKKNDLLTVVNV